MAPGVEDSVESGKDEQDEGTRQHETADDADRQGLEELRALAPRDGEGRKRERRREDRHRHGPEASPRSANPRILHREAPSEALPRLVDHEDAILADDPDHHDRADETRDVERALREHEGGEDSREDEERHEARQERRPPVPELEEDHD